jgi:hypothetical protein
MDWQPIEIAPKDGTCVLVYPCRLTGITCEMARYDSNELSSNPRPFWRRLIGSSIRDSRDNPPTHWMPLPEPPK